VTPSPGRKGPAEVQAFGTTFQNPVLLAAGTCGFGVELVDVIDLEGLGGIVTKSVTAEPRKGNPAPRVAEFGGGMINSVGLANPGMEGVRREKLPWLEANLKKARVFVSVAGHTIDEYERVVAGLDGEKGFLGFELNLSCPNDLRRNGLAFALDPEALAEAVARCRARTERPLLVKLAPNDPDVARTVRTAENAGADGLTLINTLPGLIIDPQTGKPALGAGGGGVSGPVLRALGVGAVARARAETKLPLVGVGGIQNAQDALHSLPAGASLRQLGTINFADPRASGRIIRQLEKSAAQGRLPVPSHVSSPRFRPVETPDRSVTGARASMPETAGAP
jgi:dihydroorotate dehydrogenase (NAD+) catalytic subunit